VDQGEILQAQVEREGRVVVAREDRRRVVPGDERVAHGVADRLPEGVERHSVAQPQCEPFADGCGGDEPELVGHQLDDVARAQRATRDDAAQLTQERGDRLDRVGVATHEQRQPSRPGAVHGTGHRRVDDPHARRCAARQLGDQLDAVRGEVDPGRARTERTKRSTGHHHGLHVIGAGERGQEDVGRGGGRRGGVGGDRAGLDRLGDPGRVEVEGVHRVTGPRQTAAHRSAHRAEAHESQRRHRSAS